MPPSNEQLNQIKRGPMIWGNNAVGAAATPARYLDPGYTRTTASTAPVSVVCPGPAKVRNLYVRHNRAVGNGNPVVYTVMKNGVATALQVTLASGAIGQAADTTHVVDVATGDYIDIQVTKGAAIGAGSVVVIATLEVS